MRFAYYRRLSRVARAIYRQSDEYGVIELESPAKIRPIVRELDDALASGARRAVRTQAARLCRAITDDLGVAPVALEILEVRPHGAEEELHGLYDETDDGRARIRVWMRTARHQRLVAFRTFLRTVLHELCHHLDYELLELADSFHTEGFFMRESSLLHQLVPGKAGRRP